MNFAYAYNNEGKMTRVTYPTDAYGTTPYFNYSFDPMMRPAGMTDQNSASVVSGVTYGPANELTQMTYSPGTETRTYNSMLQLTNITGVTSQNVTYQNINYTFPAANAGKITSQTDNVSGETVSYLYDSLNRLTWSYGSGWQQHYTYDGFGNLTNRTGYGTAQSTTISTPADAATNRLSGYSYDLNGNQISTGYAYDAENRLVQANAGAVQYGYDGQNKRIWQASFSNCSGDSCLSSDSISLFGIDGKLIGTYGMFANWNNSQTQIQLTFGGTQRVYFGSKLVATLDSGGVQHGVVQDRLESVGKYYPFGEERNSPPLANDQVKFASYTRDSATALDYADQRYYANTFGRFMNADPYVASGGPADPKSWNRYSYTRGDPINRFDPEGLEDLGFGISVITYSYETFSGFAQAYFAFAQFARQQQNVNNAAIQQAVRTLTQFNSFTTSLQNQFANALDKIDPGCRKALEDHGVDFKKIRAQGVLTTFYDTRQDWIGNLYAHDVSGAPTLDTLRQYVGTAYAAVLVNNFNVPVNKVVIGSNFYTQSNVGLGLLHEELHIFFGLYDSRLAAQLGLGEIDDRDAASRSIQDWLETGCHPIQNSGGDGT